MHSSAHIRQPLGRTHTHLRSQICITGSSDVDTTTDRFTPGLTYFPGSLGLKCKNHIFRQLWWHKL